MASASLWVSAAVSRMWRAWVRGSLECEEGEDDEAGGPVRNNCEKSSLA